MTEQQASGEQTSNEEQSQADLQQGADEQQESRQTQDSQESREITDLPDWAQKIIRDERKESAKYRKQVKGFEDAEKSELQRLTDATSEWESKYSELESKYRNTIAEREFIRAATEAKAVAPRTLFRAYKSDIEFDDDGNVTNLSDVIDRARADEPGLFRSTGGDGDGGKGRPTPTGNNMNDLFRTLAENKQ